MNAGSSGDRRILILAPTGRDATLAQDVIDSAGHQAEICVNETALCAAMEDGAAVLLIAEEALTPDAMGLISATLGRQQAWSDLPVVILAAPVEVAASVLRTQRMIEALGNVSVVERPTRVATLITAIRAGLRARARQYSARDTVIALKSREAELRENDARKNEFIAMLSHELRNPLSALSMALLLSERSHNDSDRAKHGKTAKRQVQNLVRLVDDLLDMSRITRGLVELRKDRVDFANLVRSAITAVRPTVESRQHALTLQIGTGPFFIHADPTRVEQVVTNLLSNAAKYTEPGGQIHVTLSRTRVDGAPVVVLSVRDSGRGIPKEMLDRVFDMFVQVEHTIDRNLGGLGLGLTLVDKLVRMHGGGVEAVSEGRGKGSEFLVRLPLIEEGVKIQSPSAANTIEPTPPRRILVIEDSEDVRETLRESLEDLGHEVEVARDGLDGAAKAPLFKPDIAFVDIGLPGIDGYEVARRIRATPGVDKSYLVALTGYGGSEVRAKAAKAGFDLHLTKPFNLSDLKTILVTSGSTRLTAVS